MPFGEIVQLVASPGAGNPDEFTSTRVLKISCKTSRSEIVNQLTGFREVTSSRKPAVSVLFPAGPVEVAEEEEDDVVITVDESEDDDVVALEEVVAEVLLDVLVVGGADEDDVVVVTAVEVLLLATKAAYAPTPAMIITMIIITAIIALPIPSRSRFRSFIESFKDELSLFKNTGKYHVDVS